MVPPATQSRDLFMDVPDHRRLGLQLKISPPMMRAGPGCLLRLPAGAIVRSEIERFIVDLERRHGYLHVYTPEMAKRELYERSGHWAHYHDDMYPPMDVGTEQVVLRPMNCPHHILVYRSATSAPSGKSRSDWPSSGQCSGTNGREWSEAFRVSAR